MRIRLISLIIFLIIISCKTDRDLAGKYRTNFPDLGFFMTEIYLNSDSSFQYVFSGDLIHTELDGIYKVCANTLYLRFNFLKEDFETTVFDSTGNSLNQFFSDFQNIHVYELKNENGIEYHLKYRISGDKLKPYHIENDIIVRRNKYYTDMKRFFVFGPNYKIKRWYLQKVE